MIDTVSGKLLFVERFSVTSVYRTAGKTEVCRTTGKTMKIKLLKSAIVAVTLLAAINSLMPQLNAGQTNKGTRSVWDGAYTREQAKRGEATLRSTLLIVSRARFVGKR